MTMEEPYRKSARKLTIRRVRGIMGVKGRSQRRSAWQRARMAVDTMRLSIGRCPYRLLVGRKKGTPST